MHSSLSRLLLLLAAWFVAVFAAGAGRLFQHLPPYVAQLTIAALSIGLSIAITRVGWLAEAAASVGIRTILALHLARFIGLYFLWLHAQGRLPVEFAQRAGWGDVAAAVGAGALLLWPEGPGFRRVLSWW